MCVILPKSVLRLFYLIGKLGMTLMGLLFTKDLSVRFVHVSSFFFEMKNVFSLGFQDAATPIIGRYS